MIKSIIILMFIGVAHGIPLFFTSISRPIISSQKKIEIPNDECGICNFIVLHSEKNISNSTNEAV